MNVFKYLFYMFYGLSDSQIFGIILVFPILWGALHWYLIEQKGLNLKLWRVVCTFLTIGSLISIIYLTVGMRSPGASREVELIPFISLAQRTSAAKEVDFLNVLLFEPLGVLMPCVFGKSMYNGKSIWKEILLCVLLSATIEFIQYIFAFGLAETDDVIFNTLGYVIGRGLSLLTVRVLMWCKQNGVKHGE